MSDRPALSRGEAAARSALIQRPRYQVSLDLTGEDDTFSTTTAVSFGSRQLGASTFIDLDILEIGEAELNGRRLARDSFRGGRLYLDDLQSDNLLRVRGLAKYRRSGVGLHRHRDPADGLPYLHTQFEVCEANKVFANFDQPDLKGIFAFEVTVPAGWQAWSNMPAEASRPEGTDTRTSFAPTPPLPSYATAIVAGPYHRFAGEHRGIPLGVLCRRSMRELVDADEVLATAKRGLDFYEQYLDYPLPFPKYDQAFVAGLNGQAMENAGCVTLNESLIFQSTVNASVRRARALVLLHELAHMWFGNLVTMRWWDDLWLKESFANYFSLLAQSEYEGGSAIWAWFLQGPKAAAVAADHRRWARPIAADCVDTRVARTAFDSTTYHKGAQLLRELSDRVGPTAFRDGLRQYLRRHEFGTASLADMLAALRETSGRDLSRWCVERVGAAGGVTLRVTTESDGDRYRAVTLVKQSTSADVDRLSHRVGIGLYDLTDGRLRRRRQTVVDTTGPHTSIGELAGERVADLIMPNDDDLSDARIRLDPRSLRTVATHLAGLEEPIARAVCWTAVWEQVAGGELPARAYVQLVLDNLSVEREAGTVLQLLAQVQKALGFLGAPTSRSAVRRRLASRALEELEAARPGSDLQRIWASTFVSNARSPEHLTVVKRLLESELRPDGLSVDSQLRWLMVTSLAAVGAVADRVIDAAEAADPTEKGRGQAITARALRPTAEAKAQAWAALVLENSASPVEIPCYLRGFRHDDQAHLVHPYLERYFGSLSAIWATRTPETALHVVRGLYPSLLVGQELLDLTDRTLADQTLPDPVRRVLVDQRENVAIALRCRAVDEAAEREEAAAGGRPEA